MGSLATSEANPAAQPASTACGTVRSERTNLGLAASAICERRRPSRRIDQEFRSGEPASATALSTRRRSPKRSRHAGAASSALFNASTADAPSSPANGKGAGARHRAVLPVSAKSAKQRAARDAAAAPPVPTSAPRDRGSWCASKTSNVAGVARFKAAAQHSAAARAQASPPSTSAFRRPAASAQRADVGTDARSSPPPARPSAGVR